MTEANTDDETGGSVVAADVTDARGVELDDHTEVNTAAELVTVFDSEELADNMADVEVSEAVEIRILVGDVAGVECRTVAPDRGMDETSVYVVVGLDEEAVAMLYGPGYVGPPQITPSAICRGSVHAHDVLGQTPTW